jgi:hypothetical protein
MFIVLKYLNLMVAVSVNTVNESLNYFADALKVALVSG